MNIWKVQWTEAGKKLHKKFESDSPSEAVAYGKTVRSRGLTVYIISTRKAFDPPLLNKEKPWLGHKEAPTGFLWCPYCIAFREFHESSVKRKWAEGVVVIGPEVMRCTVCTISIYDYHVRQWNPFMVARFDPSLKPRKIPLTKEEHSAKKKAKKIRRKR